MGSVERAAAVIRNDGVEEIASVRAFIVKSDHSKYRVLWIKDTDGKERIECPCKAGEEGIMCYHVIAVTYIVKNNKKVRKL